MNKDELKVRQDIVTACHTMNDLGINQGTSGNVSARFGTSMLITPSGLPYDEMTPEDIVVMSLEDGYGSYQGGLAPSSEWRFHLDIMLARPEVGGIVHTHSTYATSLAICGREIPAVHYMIAAAGGPTIRVAPYATYGTAELSRHAVAALEGRNACLLANHGVIATGATLQRALWLAGEVETLAKQYYLSLTLGKPQILPDAEIARVVERFKSYGPRPKASKQACSPAPRRKRGTAAKTGGRLRSGGRSPKKR